MSRPDGGQDNIWATLMSAAQRGDGAAYARLLGEIAPFIRVLLRRQGIAASLSEDIVQDVLLSVHRVRGTYDPARPFIPWLAAITRRRMLDALRRSRRIDAFEQPGADMLEAVPDPGATRSHETMDNREWLQHAIQALPPKQRLALELVKLRELPVAEAAVMSGQTQGAVKVNVHRAIKTLRSLLGVR